MRDKALIGQILACPCCGSMVEVAEPKGPAEADVDAEPADVAQTIESTPELVAEQAFELPSETNAAVDDVALLDVSEQQVLAELARYKLITWSVVGAFAGVAVIGLVLLTRGDATVEIADTDVKSVVVQPDDNPAAEPSQSTKDADALSEIVKAQSETLPKDTNPTQISEQESVAEETVAEIKEIVEPEPPIEVAATESPAEKVESKPTLARRIDPLLFDPENLTLAKLEGSPEQADSPVEPLVEEAPAPDIPASVEASVEELPSTMPAAHRGQESGNAIAKRDATEQLSQVIPALKFDNLSLVDCLRLFSQLSGVPVSVAPDQLLMAGVAPEKKISLDVSDASLGALLNKVLQPIRLEYVTQGEQVIILRREVDKIREVNYAVDDLCDESLDEQKLAAWIKQLIAPGIWETESGQGALAVEEGRLRIKATQQVQYKILILLERMRLAKGLPPKSRYPVKRLAGMPGNLLLEKQLRATATFTFLADTPIDEVFAYWQTELGVPLLIDWPALAEVEIWPTTMIACVIHSEPWSAALENVLDPLGLGWRATASGAIEITTAQKTQSELQLEIYPLKGDANKLESLVKQFRALVGKRPDLEGNRFLADPASKFLLSLQPVSLQRLVYQRLRRQQMLPTK